MDFYIAVCAGVGEGFKKLKPVQNMIDSIGAVLGQAKAIEDSITKQLPRERKRLEPPKRQLPPPSQRRPESGPGRRHSFLNGATAGVEPHLPALTLPGVSQKISQTGGRSIR